MKRYTADLLSEVTGMSLLGATLQVVQPGTNTRVTVYADDDDAGDTVSQPIANGTAFYVSDGRYDLLASGPRGTKRVEDVDLFDLFEQNRRLEAVENGEPGALGSLRADLLSTTGASRVTFSLPGFGGRQLSRRLTDVISLADFGYWGDYSNVTGTGHDDTQAWRAAIAYANAFRVRTIRVPFGVTGVSLVTGSIVNGKLLSGIRFQGEAVISSTEFGDNVRVHYTGDGVCWNIDHADWTGVSSGGWIWEGIDFRATKGSATMFDFNDTVNAGIPSDIGGHEYLASIQFKRCLFYGAHAGAQQTGDAIRGAKVFRSHVDAQCYIRGWRRGVWLYGCDDNRLSASGVLNAQLFRIEAAGSFGNTNKVDSPFGGWGSLGASENQYAVWDNGNSTSILEMHLEEGAYRSLRALLFLDGLNTAIYRPRFAGAKMFELGPRARDIVLLQPSVTTFNADWEPIIAEPVSWDFGNEQENYRMMVLAANRNFQAIAGTNPRILYEAGFPNSGAGGAELSRSMAVNARGYGPRQIFVSGLGGSVAARVQNGASVVTGEGGTGGYAFQLPAGTPGQYRLELLAGRDVFPSWYRIEFRRKQADTAVYAVQVRLNGTPLLTFGGLPSDNVWRQHDGAVDLTMIAPGDTVTIAYAPVTGGNATGTAHLDYLAFTPTEPTIDAPTGGGTVDAEARAAISSMLSLLRRRGDMA